ncbi:MAG: ABC transporter ATP-binding protein [Thermomicrobium sp.]|nr:ABC transporter ATP-binding protein [Thermomicrobium sp.]
MTDEPVLAVHELTKQFGTTTAVDGLSFALGPGELVGLLGPNGAGKTTTLAMITGLIRPTAGRIVLFGRPLEQDQTVLRRVGFMPEVASFYPYLNARQNLQVMARVYGADRREIDRLLELVGLAEHAARPFRTYSQGMRQMLSLANALLGDPDLLLLDEPTNGLDPFGQQRVHQLLRDLVARGKTVVLSSHLLRDVQELCQRVIIIQRGKLVQDSPIERLLRPGELRVLVRTVADDRALVLLSSPARPPWISSVDRHDDHLVVHLDPQHLPELSAFLVRHELYLRELRPLEGDLVAAFVELTREHP